MAAAARRGSRRAAPRSLALLLPAVGVWCLAACGCAFLAQRVQPNTRQLRLGARAVAAAAAAAASAGAMADAAAADAAEERPAAAAPAQGEGGGEADAETQRRRGVWKRELFRLAASRNRGFDAAPGTKARLMELVELLERSFDAPESGMQREALLEGVWSIVFTTSPDLASLDRLPLPGWRTARIGQSFFNGGDATNEIEFVSPLGSRVNQTVQCTWQLSERAPAKDMKVDLTFRGSSTKLASVAGLDLPFEAPPLSLPLPPATGVFKVSFLDGELLVQRTSAGGRGVNVLVREGGRE